MREKFINWAPKEATLAVVAKAQEILAEYKARGRVVTLRQLYYQFVARDLIKNEQKEYKRLGEILNQARLAGMIDWNLMIDRTRELERIPRWSSPSDILEGVAEQYQEDLWAKMKNRVEVWIEKDALIGVIEDICRELRVDYFACRGNVSQSSQYEAGIRFQRYAKKYQRVTVLHLGDHDPNGIDMSRDNAARLSMFSDGKVTLKRIALTMEQVEQYNPPPNPAKESDSRYERYVAEFGITDCWELDALDPDVISDLITDEVLQLRDDRLWESNLEQENENKKMLKETSDRWGDVVNFLNDDDTEEED